MVMLFKKIIVCYPLLYDMISKCDAVMQLSCGAKRHYLKYHCLPIKTTTKYQNLTWQFYSIQTVVIQPWFSSINNIKKIITALNSTNLFTLFKITHIHDRGV